MHARTLLLCGLASVALAPGAGTAATIAITNAHILSMGPAGEISSGTVIIRDGRVAEVGAKVVIPPGAERLDAGGRTITPGFIMAGSALAIREMPSYGILDDTSTSSQLVSAGYDVRYSVNTTLPEIPEARWEGVTSAIATPSPGRRSNPEALMFGGQAAVIHLGEGGEPILKAQVGVTLDGGGEGAGTIGGGRGAQIVLLRQVLADARRFAADRRAFNEDRMRTLGLSAIDLEALVPIVRRQAPLIVSVNNANDIRTLLRFAAAENIKLVLMDAPEGWMVAREIAAAGVPVIVDPEMNVSSQLDELGATYENAARLAAAGVTIAFKSVHARPDDLVRSPRVTVGRLVGNAGLPKSAALAGLTIGAAQVGGVADRLGSIAPGKIADLVVWDGDPLEASSKPYRIYIAGEAQPLETRMRLMGERFLARYRASGVLPPAQAVP